MPETKAMSAPDGKQHVCCYQVISLKRFTAAGFTRHVSRTTSANDRGAVGPASAQLHERLRIPVAGYLIPCSEVLLLQLLLTRSLVGNPGRKLTFGLLRKLDDELRSERRTAVFCARGLAVACCG